MPTKEILNSYSVLELRKEVSKTNIKGYSKMKKSEVVELMMKPNNKPKFHHIKTKTKATKAKASPAAPAPKKTYKFKKKEKAKPSSVGIAVVPEKKETAGEKLTGLTKEQMNKLSPSELFGKLPVALAKKVLTSGTKVGRVTELAKFIKMMKSKGPIEENISMKGKFYTLVRFSDRSIQPKVFENGKKVGEGKSIYQSADLKTSDERHHRGSGRGTKVYIVLDKERDVRYVNDYDIVKKDGKKYTKYGGDKFNVKLVYT